METSDTITKGLVACDDALAICAELLSSFTTNNPSGVIPIDLRVVVRPDPVDEKKGSIIIPGATREQERHAQTKGTLIAIGENAWEEAEERAVRYGRPFQMPQPGDRVMVGKYSGIDFKGADGLDYKMLNDSDVTGRLEE